MPMVAGRHPWKERVALIGSAHGAAQAPNREFDRTASERRHPHKPANICGRSARASTVAPLAPATLVTASVNAAAHSQSSITCVPIGTSPTSNRYTLEETPDRTSNPLRESGRSGASKVAGVCGLIRRLALWATDEQPTSRQCQLPTTNGGVDSQVRIYRSSSGGV